MVMKIKGKTYDYSVLKVFLPDVTFDQLKQLTDFYEMPNNAHTLVALVNTYYNDMIRLKELAKMEQARKENEEKRSKEQVGETSVEPTDRNNGEGTSI